MPSEIRHILFTASEALEALVEQRRRSGGHLPRGSIEAAAVENASAGGAVEIRVALRPDLAAAGADATKITFPAPEILSALMAYCRNRNIPLPMRGDKTVQRFGSKVGLVITMTAKGQDKAAVGALTAGGRG